MDPRSIFAPDLFAGTTAIVTGGGTGIGRATALGFARYGASVVLASRNVDNLRAVGEEIDADGGAHLVVETNIRDIDAVERLRDTALDRFGAVDFVVNNAGGQFMAPPSAISDNGWRAVVDLNLHGTWNMCSRFLPHLIDRGRGTIVNVVHAYTGERGAPMFAHSGAARAGVIGLTRSLAPYAEAAGVTVNAMAPGNTMSAKAAANYGYTEDEWRATQPRAKWADPEEIAAILLFLCSPAARMINGAVIVADAASTQVNWPILDDMLDGSA